MLTAYNLTERPTAAERDLDLDLDLDLHLSRPQPIRVKAIRHKQGLIFVGQIKSAKWQIDLDLDLDLDLGVFQSSLMPWRKPSRLQGKGCKMRDRVDPQLGLR